MSIILAIVITCGNLLIILSVYFDPLHKLRTPFNYFLVNLASSDLLVGIVTTPVMVAAHFQEVSGWLDRKLVTAAHLSYFISGSASVLSLGALCMDRCLAIRWPIKYRRSLRLSRCGIISVGIWGFSGALSMLYLKVGFIDYLMVFVHAAVSVTFVILVLTYHLVYKSLRNQADEIRSIRRTNQDEAKKEDLRKVNSERKVTRAFLMILLLFLCCYIPAIIMIYILQFCDQCNCTLQHVLRDFQFLLIPGNSAVNPFICAIRLKAFRRAIIKILRCQLQREKHHGKGQRSGTVISTSSASGTISTSVTGETSKSE